VDSPLDKVPGYQTIRVTAPLTWAAARADEQAWKARDAYPDLCFAGGPVFGSAHERDQGGWELHAFFTNLFPQDARDSMAPRFRMMAKDQPEESAARSECLRAADRLDWEVVDEMTVLGTRYRVVRADQFIRSGPYGPEPPRATDPDPGGPGRSGGLPDPVEGFVIDPVNATGMSEGILKLELLEAMRQRGSVPAEVRDDLARAMRTHPGGVLLPPSFIVGELTRGQWGPVNITASRTPQAARNSLVSHLRVWIPYERDLDPDQRAVFAAAADTVEEEHANEVTVAGRRFRIVRVERLVRIGPDGPEGPRPSDPDPQPPVMVQAQQLPPHREEDENKPIELSDDAKRLARLFHEEEARLQARRPTAE
jgi:Family of unknown function (DUF5954)